MPRLRALAAFAALCALAAAPWVRAAPGAVAAEGDATGAIAATPAERKVSARVGVPVAFSVSLASGGTGRWRLDGATVGSGPAWTFVPGPGDVGTHVVELEVSGGGTTRRRQWGVRVTPPRLPRVAAASPATDTVTTDVDRDVVLRFDVRPGTPGETVRVTWSVDGAPAGEGDTLHWRATEPANVRARALAVGSLGAAVGREWRILVRLPTTTTTTTTTTLPMRAKAEGVEPMGPLPPSRPAETARAGEAEEPAAEPEAEEPASEPEAQEEARAREDEPPAAPPTTIPPTTVLPTTLAPTTTTSTTAPPVVTTSTVPPPIEPAVESAPPPRELARAEPAPEAPPPPPPPPPPPALASRGTDVPSGGAAGDEVRRLLDRYAAAWRNHDVAELRRIGQVTSEKQAEDMTRYFAKVEDLDVEVTVLDIRTEGDRATVRFTRRDRFRDPSGRMVTQESPPIEKRVVRSADGMRFEGR